MEDGKDMCSRRGAMDKPTSLTLPPGMALSMAAKGAEVPKTLPDNFAFVMNVSRLVGANSFTLAPGHELRRATHEEISTIREMLQRGNTGLLGLHSAPWEFQKEANGSFSSLPEEEWRYFVIGFQGSNDKVIDIDNAFGLAPLELRVAFTVLRSFPSGCGFTYHPGRLFQMLEEGKWGRTTFLDVGATDATQIAILYNQLQEHDDMRRIAGQLLDLESLPPASPVGFLGYFAILESLLTHRPNPTDPYDSITRQVKKKLALLDHRWEPRIDYSAFGKTKPETVWTKMYACRSCLAHGDTPDFPREFKVLGDARKAMNLLKQTARAVARQALSEPQLIADLKDC